MNVAVNLASNKLGTDRPPSWFWGLPLAVALLRSIPYFCVLAATPPTGQVYLKLGYIPKDFLAYLAFMRQVGDTGAAVFVNPFTTEPQAPRFVFLFHWLLGAVAAVTGHMNAVLELSRFPLACLVFWLLWRFSRWILADRRERIWACILVAFSGGVESFLRPFITYPNVVGPFQQDTWELYGWNTFASCFNPLWMAALACILITLEPIFKPGGPAEGKDYLQLGLGFLCTYLVHPYSAIFIGAFAVVWPAVTWALRAPVDTKKVLAILTTLAIPGAAIAALAEWQAQEPVYRQSASGVFGPQSVSVFWYPVTLGVLGLAAIRGGQICCKRERPARYGLLAWIVTVVLLHTSPLLNGYKFVFLLHLPLCIVAAPYVAKVALSQGNGDHAHRAVGILAAVALFGQVLLLPWQSARTALQADTVPVEYAEIATALAMMPPGNVLAPPDLGNIIPAYTSDRVWVGQWFLTPNYAEKVKLYADLTGTAQTSSTLQALIQLQRIRYLVLPLTRARSLDPSWRPLVEEARSFGDLALLTLNVPGSNVPRH